MTFLQYQFRTTQVVFLNNNEFYKVVRLDMDAVKELDFHKMLFFLPFFSVHAGNVFAALRYKISSTS